MRRLVGLCLNNGYVTDLLQYHQRRDNSAKNYNLPSYQNNYHRFFKSPYAHVTSKCVFQDVEQFMIKAYLFINGHSLKNRCNEEHYLLKHRGRAGLETLHATLLILTMEQPFSSINALPKDVSNSSWILYFEVSWVYTPLFYFLG